jgi:hypothetical protein
MTVIGQERWQGRSVRVRRVDSGAAPGQADATTVLSCPSHHPQPLPSLRPISRRTDPAPSARRADGVDTVAPTAVPRRPANATTRRNRCPLSMVTAPPSSCHDRNLATPGGGPRRTDHEKPGADTTAHLRRVQASDLGGRRPSSMQRLRPSTKPPTAPGPLTRPGDIPLAARKVTDPRYWGPGWRTASAADIEWRRQRDAGAAAVE